MRKPLLLFLTTMILLHSKVKGQSGSGSGSGDINLAPCGPLFSPLNGTVYFGNSTSGSVGTYSCDDGFILVGGNETRTCYNGVWSSSDPTCNSSILLPYGRLSAGDELYDFFTIANFNFTFFGRNETTIFVQYNGILAFTDVYFSDLPDTFPLFSPNALLTPFWTFDVFSFERRALFRDTTDERLLNYVGSLVSQAFFPPFSPSSLFIATWVDLPGLLPNQNNTFQAVISTDGTQTYVLFLYHSIQWGESDATVGFNAGDRERSFTLTDRFTASIDFDSSSNVGIPGLYIFRVDQDEIIVPQGPPVQGVDYIPFLDLEAQDGVECQRVMPDNNFIIANSDYFSEPIFVNTGIPIGGQGQQATELYVLSDGAITFERGVALYAPQRFPYSDAADIQLVAPFLADHDPRVGGSVKYKVYDMNSLDGMDTVSSFIRNSNTSDNFQGNWMLAAEWRDVPMFGGNISITNTYQAIVISDGIETFSVFIYNCDLLNWVGREGSYASIGFSVRGQADDFQNFANSLFSQESTVRQTACRNVRFDVPYATIVYKVGVASTGEQRARGTCLERVTRDQSYFNVPFQSIRFQFFLQDCPCTLGQASRDANFILYSVSADRLICYLGINFQFSFPTGEKFAYRCCYSRFTGSIVSGDSEGYGSILSLYQEPARSLADYISFDFQRECCIDADLCDQFYARRIPLYCSSYTPPVFSACNGDPHFLSLDGALGTFNGWGEYTLSRVGQFLLQGRTTAVDPSDPTSATKFSAIAFGPPGTIVEIDLVDDSLQVLLNSVDITDTINATKCNTSTAVIVEPRPISFQRISENSIRTQFSTGVTITVTLAFGMLNFVGALPQTLQGIPVGLLGNFNGDTSDDLIYPNGTQIDINSPDALVHDFGQSWMINPEDSLFTYPPGMGPEDFSFPNHVPSFLDEVLAGATEEVMNECGSDAMCVFDATQTGNLDIGLMTKTLIETDVENRLIVANFPPNITGPSTFMVTMNQQSSFDIYVTDTNFDSFSIISGDLVGGSLTRNDDYVSLYTFTWTPVDIPANPIVFLATDDMNATSQYIPRIEFCQCLNNGECTLQGLLDQTANPIMLSCICDNAYEGEICGDDVDGCRDMPCFPGVECTDSPAPDVGATCGSCPQGYSQNEGKCLDIDECAGEGLGTTLCAVGCVNLPGGYVCSNCSSGFQLVDDTQCRDFDECAGEGSGNTCEQGCVNYPGGFDCTCLNGFELVNSIQCRDIDECAGEGLGNLCSEGCVNTPGGYDCSRCIEGYELNDTQCQDLNECIGDNSVCEQGCVNYIGGFNCTCLDGFELVDNVQCRDYDECAGENSGNMCEQRCFNYPGGFNCSCFYGFEPVNDVQCRDFDECAGEGSGNTCEQGCVNSPGGFNCNCLDGFELVNDAQCRDFDECAGEGSGNICEQGCVNYPGGFNCTCLDEFELVDDTQCQAVSMTTTTTTTMAPATLSPVQKNNAVVIILSDFTVETFDADQQALFREETASGINRYCSSNSDQCPVVNPVVKVLWRVQAGDVILTSIENNDEGGIDLIMYVELSDGMLLRQQALLQAIESNAGGYIIAGFGVPSVEVLDSPPLVSVVIIGIIVAAAVAAILLLIITIMVICCCCRCRKSVQKEPENPGYLDNPDKPGTQYKVDENHELDGDGVSTEIPIKKDHVEGESTFYNEHAQHN